MICTRPDISYAVYLMQYVKSTRDYKLIYPNLNKTILTGYSDSDHAGDLGKSTSGFIFILGGCTINWKSTKQKTVAIQLM